MPEQYPDYLLPRPEYQLIVFGDETPALPTHFLIRHTETEDIKDEFGNLRSDCVAFQTDHLHDYSTNLLGIFQIEDLRWKWLKGTICGDLWTIGEDGLQPVLEQDVTITENRGAFFLKIKELHQQLFDLPAPVENTEKVECHVLHTPTRANFWHFSLRWIIEGEDTTNWEKKRRRKVLETARSIIITLAIFEQPIFQRIPASYFVQ
ncbi:MAG: hypothetical protein MUE30_01365 [Spirosomaceae bacterium]|jgi:hypothetical protein|nr:hypothetical protein [Spirosomataceae bacterium]